MNESKFNKLVETNTGNEKPISGLSPSCKIVARNNHSFLSRFLSFFGFSQNYEDAHEVAAEPVNSKSIYKKESLIDGVSEEIALLAQNNHSSLFRIFSEHSLDYIAARLNIPRSCVDRIRNGTELGRMAALLASVGYTVVGKNQAVYDVEYVKALEVLAHKNLSSINKAQS